MAAKGYVTLDEIWLVEVDADPSVSGVDAPMGSTAFLNGAKGTWEKVGPANTDWQFIYADVDFRNITLEPTGFITHSTSSISFVNGTRRFTITPVGGSFSYYIRGVKYTKTSAESVDITNNEGLWYIYYSGATLTASRTPWKFDDPVAFVSYLYWDSANSSAIVFGEERHFLTMDWATHERLHKADGLKSEYGGFTAGNYNLLGDGSLDSHCQLSISNGIAHDEDISISVLNSATPTNPFEQILSPIANIPIYYRSGSNGDWRKLSATQFPAAYQTGSTIRYNKKTTGVWGLSNVTDGYVTASWLFVTNNINEPIICILGQSEKPDVSSATSEMFFSTLDLSGFPVLESQLLYRVFIQSSVSYANTPKAKIVAIDGLLIPNIVPSPVVNYKITSATPFTTTSTSDTLITGMTVTPQAGTYAVWFSSDLTIGANNNVGQIVIYKAGAAVPDSRRNSQGSSSNFKTQGTTMSIVSVDGTQAIDIRMNISSNGNSFTSNQRSMLLIRLSA